MIVYWLILSIPLIAILSPIKFDIKLINLFQYLFGIILVILIGLRFEVGGDWYRYLYVYSYLDNSSFFESFRANDIGYEALYWLSKYLFNSIYLVNVLNAAIFVYGLMRFCRFMPMPWLALLVSIPYLVIVVSMGYTRQATAIGITMLALISLAETKRLKFYMLVFLGALFHKTAVLIFLLDFFYNKDKFNTFSVVTLTGLLFAIFSTLSNYFDHLFYYYVKTNYHESDGAVVRTLMNAFAGLIFFIHRDRFEKIYNDGKLWYLLSIASLFFLVISFNYSTFSDRMSLYLIPLQIVVFSRLFTLYHSKQIKTILILAITSAYVAVMFTWLFFANHANVWLPYKNILLE